MCSNSIRASPDFKTCDTKQAESISEVCDNQVTAEAAGPVAHKKRTARGGPAELSYMHAKCHNE